MTVPGRWPSSSGGGLVDPQKLRELFEAVVPRLYRYPAIDPASLGKRRDEALRPKPSSA